MKRVIAMILAVMFFSAACAEPALTVGSTALTDGEVSAYAWSAGEAYREIAKYYEQYLHIDYWSLEYPGGMSIEESIAADAFKQLVITCVLCEEAAERKLSLSDADRNICCDEAFKWYDTLQSPSFALADVQSLYEKQLLASREYALMVSEIDIDSEAVQESLSPSDWTVYTVSYLYTTSDDPERYSRMLSSTDYELTAAADALLAAGTLQLDADSTPELLETAQQLTEGETSGLIKTDYGIFVIRLESKSEEAYGTVYSQALYEARQKAFEAQYEALFNGASYTIHDSFRSAMVLR